MVSARTIEAIQAIVPIADDCTDRELLRRYSSSRNGAAFAELVRRHGPMVYGTCRRIAHNGPDADDAFQATFFVLARKADSIRSKDAVGAWLHGVAVKVAHRARRQAVTRGRLQMAAAKPEAVRPATPVADWWAVVDDELNQLPAVQRQVLLTCVIGGRSRSQAARELGWPEGTVAKRLARARRELAKRLARRGMALGVAAMTAALAAEATAAVPSQLRAETFSQATAYAVSRNAGSLAVRTLAEGVMRSMKASVVVGWMITTLATALLAGAGVMLAGALAGPPEKKTEQPAQGAGERRGPKAATNVWKKKTVIEMPGWLPGSLVYSADGKRLAVGGGKVAAYDTTEYKPQWTAEVGGNFAAVAFLADGSSLLATFRDGVRFHDPDTGKLGKTMVEVGEAGALHWYAVALGVFPDRKVRENLYSHQIIFGSPVGYVVKTWFDDGAPATITVSTVAKGAKPADANAVPLAVDPNGTSAIIAGPIHRDTGKNVLWAYVCGNYEKDSPGNRVLEGHEAPVVSAAWSKDGKTAVTGDAAGRVIFWDAKTMKETRRLEFGQRIAALALTSDGRQTAAVVVGEQAEFHVWETAKPAANAKPLHVDKSDYQGPIHASVAFSPNGQHLAGTVHNTVWLARLGELIGKVHVWESTKLAAENK